MSTKSVIPSFHDESSKSLCGLFRPGSTGESGESVVSDHMTAYELAKTSVGIDSLPEQVSDGYGFVYGLLAGRSSLEELSFPNLRDLPPYMFYNCTGVQRLYLPSLKTFSGGGTPSSALKSLHGMSLSRLLIGSGFTQIVESLGDSFGGADDSPPGCFEMTENSVMLIKADEPGDGTATKDYFYGHAFPGGTIVSSAYGPKYLITDYRLPMTSGLLSARTSSMIVVDDVLQYADATPVATGVFSLAPIGVENSTFLSSYADVFGSRGLLSLYISFRSIGEDISSADNFLLFGSEFFRQSFISVAMPVNVGPGENPGQQHRFEFETSEVSRALPRAGIRYDAFLPVTSGTVNAISNLFLLNVSIEGTDNPSRAFLKNINVYRGALYIKAPLTTGGTLGNLAVDGLMDNVGRVTAVTFFADKASFLEQANGHTFDQGEFFIYDSQAQPRCDIPTNELINMTMLTSVQFDRGNEEWFVIDKTNGGVKGDGTCVFRNCPKLNTVGSLENPLVLTLPYTGSTHIYANASKGIVLAGPGCTLLSPLWSDLVTASERPQRHIYISERTSSWDYDNHANIVLQKPDEYFNTTNRNNAYTYWHNLAWGDLISPQADNYTYPRVHVVQDNHRTWIRPEPWASDVEIDLMDGQSGTIPDVHVYTTNQPSGDTGAYHYLKKLRINADSVDGVVPTIVMTSDCLGSLKFLEFGQGVDELVPNSSYGYIVGRNVGWISNPKWYSNATLTKDTYKPLVTDVNLPLKVTIEGDMKADCLLYCLRSLISNSDANHRPNFNSTALFDQFAVGGAYSYTVSGTEFNPRILKSSVQVTFSNVTLKDFFGLSVALPATQEQEGTAQVQQEISLVFVATTWMINAHNVVTKHHVGVQNPIDIASTCFVKFKDYEVRYRVSPSGDGVGNSVYGFQFDLSRRFNTPRSFVYSGADQYYTLGDQTGLIYPRPGTSDTLTAFLNVIPKDNGWGTETFMQGRGFTSGSEWSLAEGGNTTNPSSGSPTAEFSIGTTTYKYYGGEWHSS